MYADCSVSLSILPWLCFTYFRVGRFLISTHYTHYDPWAFTINFTALLCVLLAKLPQVGSLATSLSGLLLPHLLIHMSPIVPPSTTAVHAARNVGHDNTSDTTLSVK